MTYLLRCKQIGLSFDEIDQLSTGQIYDMIIESQNDGYDYPLKATDDMYENF